MAVAREIKNAHPSARLVYLGEKGGKFNELVENAGVFDEKHYIFTGKFRRYHTETLLKKVTDLKTVVLNIKDVFKISVGIIQGILLLRKLKAHSVFLKGGSVCIPAGLGARIAGVTTVTHDSDAIPGISNRIGGRYAKYHTTAMPAKYYGYPKNKIIHVGLPVSSEFKTLNADQISSIKNEYNLSKTDQVLLITGGSNGARRLNMWCIEALPAVIEYIPNLKVVMVTGKGNLDVAETLIPEYKSRVSFIEFTTEMPSLVAIADLVITRAGATTIAEFAQSKKPIILIPNPDLTGGHQIKNAKVYADANASICLQESDIKKDVSILSNEIVTLLKNKKRREVLGANLHATLPRVPASKRIAQILTEI